MFYGEYQHSIDPKGRIILPAKFRETAKANSIEKFFLNRGFEKCLFMFSEEEWRLNEARLKELSFTNQEARTFNRLYFSGAFDVIPDGQGRILLPPSLKDFAGIKDDVVLVGVSTRIEIWDKGRWQEFCQSAQPTFEQIAEKLIRND
jgi:MraZ protein